MIIFRGAESSLNFLEGVAIRFVIFWFLQKVSSYSYDEHISDETHSLEICICSIYCVNKTRLSSASLYSPVV